MNFLEPTGKIGKAVTWLKSLKRKARNELPSKDPRLGDTSNSSAAPPCGRDNWTARL